MARRTLQLQFPRLGVVRRYNLQPDRKQAEYASPWSINVRLEDELTKRLRGGSFAAVIEDGFGSRLVEITNENDQNITDEADADIVMETQPNVVTSHGETWVNPGSGAPEQSGPDCLYRGRLIRVTTNEILASRMGNTTDWDFGADTEDLGRATVFQLSEAGLVGDDVVALIPHQDSFLLCMTADSVWVLAGDPINGTLRSVTREVGILSSTAWCKADETIYFLGSDGFYSVRADGRDLKEVSEEKVPDELQSLDNAQVKLTYNEEDGGVYVNLLGVSWFYDVRRDQFWPYTTATKDSHVSIGPIALAGPNQYGRVLNLHGITATGSASVTWRLVPGDTAEEAAANGKAAIEAALAGTSYATYVHSSGTWTAGRNHMAYPRTRAVWVVLWLSSTGTWAYEGATMTVESSGIWR